MDLKLKVKATHIKKGKLLSDKEWGKVDEKKVIASLRREILKQIRNKIQQETFSHRAKMALVRGMRTKLGENSITVIATHPAFIPLLKGKKAQQMKWLVKARSPIPIITDKGELIFRSATPKSMRDGKWQHPGHKPTTVIDKAREAAREVVRKRVKSLLLRQIQKGR